MTIQQQAIKNLLARRARLSRRLDELALEPASYSINGSVSVTNQTMVTIRAEIAAIDRKLSRLLGRARGPLGIILQLPDYRFSGGMP